MKLSILAVVVLSCAKNNVFKTNVDKFPKLEAIVMQNISKVRDPIYLDKILNNVTDQMRSEIINQIFDTINLVKVEDFIFISKIINLLIIRKEQSSQAEMGRINQTLSLFINNRDFQGETVWILVATKGNTDCLKLLIEARADVNAEDENGCTALMLAAQNGNEEMLNALIEARADINVVDNNGDTALIYAASNGHINIVTRLLAIEGININVQNYNGETALMVAAQNRHTKIVKILIREGENVNKKIYIENCEYETTVLIEASAKGHTNTVTALLEIEGININEVDNYGKTALHVAAQNGHTDTVRALLSTIGININIEDDNGYTALELSQQREDYLDIENAFAELSTISE